MFQEMHGQPYLPPPWLERARMLIAERDCRRSAGQPSWTPRQWMLPPTVAATLAAAGAGGLHVVGEPTPSQMAEDKLDQGVKNVVAEYLKEQAEAKAQHNINIIADFVASSSCTPAEAQHGIKIVADHVKSKAKDKKRSDKRKARLERRSHKKKARHERLLLLSSSDSPSESSSTTTTSTTSSDADMEEL